MIINDKSIRNIVAFCALMENNGGILDKSPDYIIEKFERYCEDSAAPNAYEWGLDSKNTAKLLKWMAKWQKRKDEENDLALV